VRIWELLEQSSHPQVLATKRFRKDYKTFAEAFASFRETFAEFIRSKYADPSKPFGKKDYPFVGTSKSGLKGWNHAHIVFGKAIAIYKANPKQILLAAVTDHLSVEGSGPRIQGLADYLDSLDMSNFTPIENIGVQQVKSTDDYQEPIQDLFYSMAAHDTDYQMLVDFAQGTNDDVLEFLGVAVPDLDQQHLDLPLLRSWAAQVLKQTRQL